MIMKKIWHLCYSPALNWFTGGVMLRCCATVAIPFVLGRLIDALVSSRPPLRFFLLLVAVALLAFFLDLCLRRKIILIARNTELRLRMLLLARFQTMSPAAVDSYNNGEIALKFYRDAGNVENLIVNIYPQFLNAFFGLVFALIAVFSKKTLIALLYLLFLPMMFVILKVCTKRLARTAHAIRTMYDRSVNGIFEFMHIFPFLKSMAADSPYAVLPKSSFRHYRQINILNDRTMTDLEFLNRFLLLLGEYSILGVACWMAWKKMIPIGDVVMFQTLFLSVLNSFSGIFQLLPGWKSTQESVNSVYELLENPAVEEIDTGLPMTNARKDITVEHLSFQYPGSRQKVFQDFSCEVKAGNVIAMTGVNGSGKTTLLKLLTGYLLPDQGRVSIGGKGLQEWQKSSFRQKISYVFQDSLLITGTIKDNITLKNPHYSSADIAEALRLSGADKLVMRMPDGQFHKIGQNGGGLSGGERQKIAIARALIRKPDILIFDEVTNHLDYSSRLQIRDLIGTFRGQTTTFIVSHDPELIKLCDQEINLDQLNAQRS